MNIAHGYMKVLAHLYSVAIIKDTTARLFSNNLHSLQSMNNNTPLESIIVFGHSFIKACIWPSVQFYL